MKAIEAFDNAIDRANHLVDLYELLHNRRQRCIRSDWADRARALFNWNAGDDIQRIDSSNAVLLIRNGDGWELEHFEHCWLGELLRSAIVAAVSSVDRYFHDMVTTKLLSQLAGDTPKTLAAIQISIKDADRVLQKALESRKGTKKATRPRTILKDAFRRVLNKKTFQGTVQIEEACAMLGLPKCWKKVQKEMGSSADDLRKTLTRIVRRRNRIVHEGDIKQASRPRAVTLNDIDLNGTRSDIDWLTSLVKAFNKLLT